MKIIQILNHSLSSMNHNVDPLVYEDDWHVKVAKNIAKQTMNLIWNVGAQKRI